jgi:16S rRNA (cytidine1402-2'-O)-methyltransferase
MIQPCLEGLDVGIISDAGCPGIADPGAKVVTEAHRNDIEVIPLVGPSSILLAMMASGLNGQNFAFNGYLPIDKRERRKEIKRLERLSQEMGQAQLFIETPYRNNQMLESIIGTVNQDTLVCVACDLTLPGQFVKTLPASDWLKKKVDLNKRPTLFILQRPSDT